MHSFSDVREKLLQTRYITQSVVLCHDVTTGKHQWFPHGMPLPIGHMLSSPTGKASHQHRAQSDSYLPAEIILARIWMEFYIIELPNPLKSV